MFETSGMCCGVDPASAVVENERSIKDQLNEIEMKLIETRSVLFNIVEGITKKSRSGDNPTEPECMQESTRIINDLSESCLSLANTIHGLMF